MRLAEPIRREFREWARSEFFELVTFAVIATNPTNGKAAVRPLQLKNIKGRLCTTPLFDCLTTARDDLAACGHAAAENALKAIFVNHRSHGILAFFVQ